MTAWRERIARAVKEEVLKTVANIFTDFGYLAIVGTGLAFLAPFYWLLDNLTHFRWQYVAILLIACPIWWRRQKRVWRALGAAALLWNIVLLVPYYWPRRAAADVPRPVLTILLFNVRTENRTPERVLEYLQRTRADIVVLQELNESWVQRLKPWSKEWNHLEYPQDDNFGLAVYSRLPRRKPTYDPMRDTTSPALSAVFLFDEKSVEVLAVHPLPPGRGETWSIRNRQYESIAEWCRQGPGNRIVVGDLNSGPWSPFFRRLVRDGRLTDTRRGFGVVPSWPAMTPILWISVDWVLVPEKLQVVGVERGPDLGSDHYPHIVRLQWKRGGGMEPVDKRSGFLIPWI